MLHAEIGIMFGERMSDGTLQARYSSLVHELGQQGVRPVILRVTRDAYDVQTNSFPEYTHINEAGIPQVRSEPVTIDLLRDFNGSRNHGSIPAINDKAVWQLTRDKALTRQLFGDLMPAGIALAADRHDADEARKSLPGTHVVIKPTIGRNSRGVSVVPLADKQLWNEALAALPATDMVMIEEFIDTTPASKNLPADMRGCPSTLRIIGIDGEPSVASLRVGVAGDTKINGDASERHYYLELDELTDQEIHITQAVHAELAARGNGYSYLGIDMLRGEDSKLGELNCRPAIVEPTHNARWAQQLAYDSARQLVSAHATMTGKDTV